MVSIPSNEDPVESEPGTLGALLYADTTKATPAEADWAALVHSIAAGDQRSLRALFERMHRLVFTLMVRLTRNRETAEELTVDVFHEVWRRAASYDPTAGTVVAWVMNLARSRAIDRLRFEHRKKRVDSHPDGNDSGLQADHAYDQRHYEERSQLLRHAIGSLTPNERLTIERAFFSELSYPQVAAQLDVPLGTVKTRARSGLAKLRVALRDIE